MITVVETSSEERKEEARLLFEEIKPFLDNGCSFKQALVKIGKMASMGHGRYNYGWMRDLIDYAKTQGYNYNRYKCSGSGSKK